MKLSPSCALLFLFLVSAAASDETTPVKKPTLWHRLLHPFGSGESGHGEKKDDPDAKVRQGVFRKLSMDLKVEPTPLKLADNRQFKATLTVSNHSDKLVQFEFPTAQRIEVLVKNSTRKLIEQWSQDQAFSSDPTLVSINPGERLEYTVNVATRDLVAGETFTVEAFFPAYPQLRQERTLIPEK